MESEFSDRIWIQPRSYLFFRSRIRNQVVKYAISLNCSHYRNNIYVLYNTLLGWCSKLLDGLDKSTIDDFGVAHERSCMQRGPSDGKER